MAFRVEPTERARQDLDQILEWLLAHEAGDAGLFSRPELPHPVAPEAAEFPFEVRQLIYSRKPHEYRILSTIEQDVVVVLHVRHGRQRRLGEPH